MALTLLILILILLVACVGALLLALYLIPIEIAGTIGYHKKPEVEVQTRWGAVALDVVPGEPLEIRVLLFGRRLYRRLVPIEERGPAEEKAKIEAEIQAEEEHAVPPLEAFRSFRRAWPYLKKPVFTALRSLRVKYLASDARLGFGNPVVTGEVYGWYWVVKGILSPLSCVSLDMEPAFTERVIEGDTSLCIAIQHPLRIMLAGAWALTKKPVRDLIRQGAAR
ncbi:MAG: DUF2953 domain-containing protein [Methanomicrobiaceae archaeon]|nr:DUF2953 domain-containing protein [Methanomicrobiaceae archaeon]